MRNGTSVLVSLGMLLWLVGCTQQPSQPTSTASHAEHDEHGHDHDHGHDHHGASPKIASPVAPSAEGTHFVMEAEPNDAQDVIAARGTAENEQEVVLVGRIGGSENPWVDGRAIFTVVDHSLKACTEIPGDNCPTPWDYCCATDKLKSSTALVKIVGEDGQPVKTDARELLGVRELTEVVVKGKAQRDDAGNLTVLATGVYVKK